jgi:hypothetical protein
MDGDDFCLWGDLASLFEYGTTFAESLFTIAHRDELQWRVRYDPTNYSFPALCFPSLFNCAQFSPSTTDRLILMAVIWIDEFEVLLREKLCLSQ